MLLAQMTQFSPAQLGTTLTILIVIAGGYWKLRRMEDYMRGKGEPHKIKPQPLVVKEAEEFATLDRVEKVEHNLEGLKSEVRLGFAGLREDRSRSTGNLHQRIEQMDRTSEARTEALRREIKADNKGMHERLNLVLEKVSEVRSSVEVCQGIHLKK
jgi:hypothetical protein